MGFYFENHQSMYAHVGMQVEKTLNAIMRRYVGNNPAHTPTYRAYTKRGILRGKDYRYEADFNTIFPESALGQYIYAWGKIWSDGPSALKFDVNCHSPIAIFVNGEQLFRSDIFQERYYDERTNLNIPLKAGWNHLVIRFRKTRGGFGGVFGTWLGKLSYYFLKPVAEFEGQEGWVFTAPLNEELAVIPSAETFAVSSALTWHPTMKWDAESARYGQLRRIFGAENGTCAIGWTRALFTRSGSTEYQLKGSCLTNAIVTIGDKTVFAADKPGAFSAKVTVPFGHQDILVRSDCRGGDWGFELTISGPDGPVAFRNPANITGSTDVWIYAGPFSAASEPDLKAIRDLNRLIAGAKGDVYWRLDAPETWVRPYNDNTLYGKWNYPLGVTLYGLLHAAKALGSAETERYVANHMQFCSDTYAYAMWDRSQYGGATNVHTLLTSLDSLDDCGSSGSALLEIAKYHDIRGSRVIADLVADYITNKQIRLPDGTFFRKNLMHTFHEDTMWADDLYMSVPFLCRYFELTKDRRYIDDAARQFLGFKKMLFIPELKLMSHVYDFMRGMATGVPWGRGNGWVIFSLSELLAVLPQDHELRGELIAMFRELCGGYLAQQDANGMWHQVVNEHDSYEETSCTSMFAYAFARGVQHGWLENPDAYVASVFKAWEALNKVSIDRLGNVHGVCRGSEFSFQSEYYKKDLLWNLNDTHGIGIVLLAGVEVLKLSKFLNK